MSNQSTVTQWIGQLKDGSDDAAGKLWSHFLQRLTRLVSDRLRTSSKSVADEEDVVLDTCQACFHALKEGRYHDVNSRQDLWKLLAVIAERKAIDQIRRSKKGIDGIRADISFITICGHSSVSDGFQQLPCSEPTPEFAAIIADDIRMQLEKLDEQQAQVAILKLQGFKNREIAAQLGRSIPTIERYTRLIRETWKNE